MAALFPLWEGVRGDTHATIILVAVIVVALVVLLWRTYNAWPVRASRSLGVVISGCDSGLGNLLARRLAARGFTVLAGVFTDAGRGEMGDVEGVIPFSLDVTDDDSVAAAAATVAAWLAGSDADVDADGSSSGSGSGSSGRRLHALVNNAGIASVGIVEWCPMSEYRRTMAVNCLGHIAMTKAMLPHLLSGPAARVRTPPMPRVVNVTSIAGVFAAPGMSSYASAKFALEGFSDSLRRELRVWGAGVAVIEPSFMSTPILHGLQPRLDAMWASLPAAVRERYGEKYYLARRASMGRAHLVAESPSLAVDAMETAVTARRPAARYKAGTAGWLLFPLVIAMPEWLSDALTALLDSGADLLPAALSRAGGGSGGDKEVARPQVADSGGDAVISAKSLVQSRRRGSRSRHA